MTRTTRTALALLFGCALPLWAQAPPAEGDDALRARLPKDCDKHKAPDRPKVHKKDPTPTARSIAESYGVLVGPLADFLDSVGEVDLVFDTDLCERREWDDEASGVEIEVTEWLLCGEVLEVELQHRAPVDPIAGILDAGVARAVYAAAEGPAVVVEGEELRDFLHLLRTRSRNSAVQTATRARLGSAGLLVPCELTESAPEAAETSGVTLVLRDGQERRFPGHARSGEFAGFSNPDLYPLLERVARRAGQTPPKE